ncbi:chemotaxis protein CheB [Sagittula stellata]|uniref:Sensory transduction histidine kinase n=1 Tax=Sagittula stellata (strain ATCC 700073 / DSM 11524 / E-37) TaxID=388399 RepID=A3K9A7_SAGS3|nr:chemotaxis protein CheB [Sagittula stellata]EBA06279.1 sensory transduction histidine kinase [Sagittula stellata E-37]
MADVNGNSESIPLVVVGASAGGLEPLEIFFESVPDETGWAFVVIQHLSPDHKSMMNEILSRKSHMKIEHIENGMKLRPDTIYLNRPGLNVELENDVFRLESFSSEDKLPRLPINAFLRSVANRKEAPTVALILSGSGSDGARGAKELRDAGGAILAQSPTEASFNSMPMAVIAEGAVDRVLRVAEMPAAIRDILAGRMPDAASDISSSSALHGILQLLEEGFRIDFSSYKPANVRRRVERRQHLRGIDDPTDYLKLLTDDRSALDELYRDLLIGVTEFYRDPEAFRVLRKEVLNKLARDSDDTSPLRIWVPGCATGEEAYTLAIEMSEALAQAGAARKFRIIATDMHRGSLERASTGAYTAQSVAGLPPEIVGRYFEKRQDKYVVDPILRQKIIFSAHDVLSDPPFMNLNLISCRNLFIYLQDRPQARVLSMFLFGLRRNGYMFLGPSESLGRFSQEFESVDARWRIFRKSSEHRPLDHSVMTGKFRARPMHETVVAAPKRSRDRSVASDIADIRNRETLIKGYDALLKRYAPPSILVTGDGSVLGWFGMARMFIDTMNNLTDWTVENIVHHDLHFTINVALEKLRQGQLESYSRKTKVTLSDGDVQTCNVRIEALDQVSRIKVMLVGVELAKDEASTESIAAIQPISDEDVTFVTTRIHELERDLRLTEQTLQHVTERLEASGEELQASNEELQASNEELQAANEELQSSNEELHAVNEELVSVSAEHERKIELLSQLNANTEQVLELLGTGVIFLDRSGRIVRFSELVAERFKLETHDIGRTFHVVGPRLEFIALETLVDQVLETGTSQTVSGEHRGERITVEVHLTKAEDERDTGVVVLLR